MVNANVIKEMLENRGYNITIIPNTKNGVALTGICFRDSENACPTFYLEEFQEAFKDDAERIVDTMISAYNDCMRDPFDADIDALLNTVTTDMLEARICARGKAGDGVITERFLDLDMYIVVMLKIGDGVGSIKVTNDVMYNWGLKDVPIKKLFKIARDNSFKAVRFESLNGVSQKLLDSLLSEGQISQEEYDEKTAFLGATPDMTVLTNASRSYGAIQIANFQALQSFATQGNSSVNGQGFYIIPSSLDELILVCEDLTDEMTAHIKQMVLEVNASVVEERIKLSDSLYYYDPNRCFGPEGTLNLTDNLTVVA